MYYACDKKEKDEREEREKEYRKDDYESSIKNYDNIS